MIEIRPFSTLGAADHGWLDARHHFSFANYWNPKRVSFGTLRVIAARGCTRTRVNSGESNLIDKRFQSR